MMTNPNPEMVILAREARSLTQSDLARKSAISQANISKYESGIRAIPDAHVHKIADILRYPQEFFYLPEQRYGFGSSCTYHRKRQTMPVNELRTQLAKINILRIQVARLLHGVEIDSDNRFERLDLEDFNNNVEQIAQYVRRKWEIPFGPIQSLAGVIEHAGGIAFRCPFGTKKVDAISQWTKDIPPLFFINDDLPGDRLRFSLAHELGHVIMHQVLSLDASDMEKEADRFAAEFLIPAKEIGPDLERVTLPDLVRLKVHWKVSMAAILYQAKNLGKITPRQYSALWEQMGKLGYRTQEPEAIPIEEPMLVHEILNVYQNEHHYSIAELSRLVVLHEDEFRKQYGFTKHKFRVINGSNAN